MTTGFGTGSVNLSRAGVLAAGGDSTGTSITGKKSSGAFSVVGVGVGVCWMGGKCMGALFGGSVFAGAISGVIGGCGSSSTPAFERNGFVVSISTAGAGVSTTGWRRSQPHTTCHRTPSLRTGCSASPRAKRASK